MVVLTKKIDRIFGNSLCRVLSAFKKKRHFDKADVKSILVIQLWGIGETVLTLPALAALRHEFPDSKIHVLATKRNKDVYFKSKSIDGLFVIGTNPFSIASFAAKNHKKFDLVVDMEEYLNVSSVISFFCAKFAVGYSHGARSGLYDIKVDYNDRQHASQTYADLVRALGAKFDFRSLIPLKYSESEKKFVQDYIEFNNLDDFVIVAPGAAESAKSRIWPLQRYSQLCDNVIEKYGTKVVLIGSLDERKLIEDVVSDMKHKEKALNSAGAFTLPQLFCFMSKAKLFVGNDSGPMHIAAAMGIRTLGLFGPNIPQRFGPYGKGNIGLYKGYNCKFSPCINVHKGQVPDCLFAKSSPDYQKCMKNISVEDVSKEIEKLI